MDAQRDAVQGVMHDIREALANHRSQIVRATILDDNHDLLATGDVLIEGNHGVFWPYVLRYEDIEQSEPVLLRYGNGTEKQLQSFERCSSSAYAAHFHIEF